MAERERVSRKETDEGILKRPKSGPSDRLHSLDRSEGESRENHPGSIKDIASLQSASPLQRARILHHLQRTYGNSYVQRLLNSSGIQAKLSVSSPDDQYEKEADAVGETISKAMENQIQQQVEEEEEVIQPKLQRQPMEEEEEELMPKLQRQPMEEEEEELMPKLQRQPIEEEEELMMDAVERQVSEASDELEGRIEAARGSGQVMPESVRDSLEPQMGYDFSEVRLHTDSESNQLSEQLNARAFTTGNDIFFRTGEYQPETGEGRKLLGHELTHVVQQGAAQLTRQATEAAEQQSSTSQKEAWKALEEARKNAWITPTRENIRALLSNAAICLGAGMEGDVKSALDSVAGKAVETVKNETGMFDLPASSLNVANDIMDKLKEWQSVDQGNAELTGQMVGERLGDWAVEQMAHSVETLRQDPADDVASHVVEKTALVFMLGRDYSPGIEAIQRWGIEKSRISEEFTEEE